MIQDYRNQGIPSRNLQGNEGLRINSEQEVRKIENKQQANNNIKAFFNEPCVTDYFYRNKANR